MDGGRKPRSSGLAVLGQRWRYFVPRPAFARLDLFRGTLRLRRKALVRTMAFVMQAAIWPITPCGHYREAISAFSKHRPAAQPAMAWRCELLCDIRKCGPLAASNRLNPP